MMSPARRRFCEQERLGAVAVHDAAQ